MEIIKAIMANFLPLRLYFLIIFILIKEVINEIICKIGIKKKKNKNSKKSGFNIIKLIRLSIIMAKEIKGIIASTNEDTANLLNFCV